MKNKYWSKYMIPNIVHFNYGFAEQNEDFLFVYYIAVLSCYVINRPDKIYFHYHYEPKGKWWEKTKELVEMVKWEIPTHIGQKVIKKVAHRSDILRLKILFIYGGIYLDIDTICVKPWNDLLNNKFVIGNEITDSGRNMGLCNAIMMSEKNNEFVKIWLYYYEQVFNPDGWQESSTFLPNEISKQYKDITILPREYFLYPSWDRLELIFEDCYDIPEQMIALHYCNHHSKKIYLDNITGFEWAIDNSYTLYGKLLMNVYDKLNELGPLKMVEKAYGLLNMENFIDNLDVEDYNKVNNLNFPNIDVVKYHYNLTKNHGTILNEKYTDERVFGGRVYNIYSVGYNDNDEISVQCNGSYEIEKINSLYKIDVKLQNVRHLNIINNNNASSIYNLGFEETFYITNNLSITEPIANIILRQENIKLNDTKFIVNHHYLSEHLGLLVIRRSDCDYGWMENLYLDVDINGKNHYFNVGKSCTNSKYVVICVEDKLEKVVYKEQKIPKKIYQTWKTHYMDTEMLNTVLSIREKNPEYEYKLFDDNEMYEYIKNNFDKDVLEAYDNLIPGAFKADLFRYCVLYKEGGVYIDCKMIAVMPLRELIDCEDELILVDDDFYFKKNNLKGIYNAFMCSIPNHPIYREAIEAIVENSKKLYYPSSAFEVTGPGLLYKIYQNYKNYNIKQLILPYIGLHHTNHNHRITYNDKIVFFARYKNYYRDHKGGYYNQLYYNGMCYKSTIELLTVYQTNDYNKIRIGNNGDGGYVLYNIDNYDGYIGCGIGEICEFDIDLLNKYNNLSGFCFDMTINKLPINFPKELKWIRKNIGIINNDEFTNLEEYTNNIKNGILKMDIEGHEWKWMNSMNNKFFNKFKQIIFEFHGILQNNWHGTIEEKINAIKKINETHYLVHIHGNNNSPLNNIFYNIPTVIEVTYIRKDLVNNIEKNTEKLPSLLDYPCYDKFPDYLLNYPPFVN